VAVVRRDGLTEGVNSTVIFETKFEKGLRIFKIWAKFFRVTGKISESLGFLTVI
jgi:hypothetical protein